MHLTVTSEGPGRARITIMDNPGTARLAGTRELHQGRAGLDVALRNAGRSFLREYGYVTRGQWAVANGAWTVAVEPDRVAERAENGG